MSAAEDGKSRRGFGSMSPERLQEVSSRGGSSVDPTKRSFARVPGLAARAGKLGGTKKAANAKPE